MIFSPVITMYLIVSNADQNKNTNAQIRVQFFLLIKPQGMIIRDRIVSKTFIHITIEKMEKERNVVRYPSTNIRELVRQNKYTTPRIIMNTINNKIPTSGFFLSIINKNKYRRQTYIFLRPIIVRKLNSNHYFWVTITWTYHEINVYSHLIK